MAGLIVLESFLVAIKTTSVFSYGFALCGGCVGLVVGMGICLYIAIKKNKDFSRMFMFLFSMIFVLLGGYVGGWIGAERIPVEEETRYKVELTEELNYKEFIEQYEVIDFKDGVYTVRKRD